MGPTGAADFERKVADTDLAAWVVEFDGDAVGVVQAYEEKDPDLNPREWISSSVRPCRDAGSAKTSLR